MMAVILRMATGGKALKTLLEMTNPNKGTFRSFLDVGGLDCGLLVLILCTCAGHKVCFAGFYKIW